jgi:flagellar basal-body rod modification protein FlgD
MTAVSGIWNHAAAAQANPLTSTKAMDSTSSSSNSNSSDSSTTGATISANDFLTLLVTEMQNQDPTSDQDPNEYINQLVNVNSLEQLISINQTLSTAYPSTSTSSTATSSAVSTQTGMASLPVSTGASATPPSNGMHGVQKSPMQPTAHPIPVLNGGPVSIAKGNLSAPSTNPSALRVARALDGQRITR